jgi:hypothetical protein
MTRFVPLSDILPIQQNDNYALLITNRQDIDETNDTILAQSDKEEKAFIITGVAEPESLRKGYVLYFLAEKVNY